MVAVLAQADGAPDSIIQVLRAQSPRSIERAEGEWRGGEWVDFDARRSAQVIAGQ
jgi:hypothetical protein